MTTVVYSDLLKVGADMSMLDERGTGTQFVFNSGTLLFDEYFSIKSTGVALYSLSGQKTIAYLSFSYKISEDFITTLPSISYLDINMDELITVSNSPYIYEGEAAGGTKNIYEGDDVIIGNKFNDFLRGGNGNDEIIGNAGNDKLLGDAGNDFLTGSNGNDTLIGGTGTDVLRGGSGADIFAFTSALDSINDLNYADMIVDFNVKQKDKIDLSAIDAISNTAVNDKFTFIGSASFSGISGQLRFSKEAYASGREVLMLTGDVNGDGVADFGIAITGISSIISSSIVL